MLIAGHVAAIGRQIQGVVEYLRFGIDIDQPFDLGAAAWWRDGLLGDGQSLVQGQYQQFAGIQSGDDQVAGYQRRRAAAQAERGTM